MTLSGKWKKFRTAGFKGSVRLLKERILQRLLLSPGRFEYLERFGIHVTRVNYASSVPNVGELRKTRRRWDREWNLKGIDWNLPHQKKLLGEVQQIDGTGIPRYDEKKLSPFGPGYGEIEALLLYRMIRRYQPGQILEVGPGVSTFYALLACEENRKMTGRSCSFTCIEPSPHSGLLELEQKEKLKILRTEVQDVPPSVFGELGPNDVVLIDGSHVVRIDGDVIYLCLECLPAIKPGVIIQIHDIGFPYLTPNPDLWVFRYHEFWTEPALVAALLQNNSDYSVLLCCSYLHYRHPDWLRAAFPEYDPQRHLPSALWLRKERTSRPVGD